MGVRRRSVDDFADQLQQRAARAGAAGTSEADSEQHLEAVLTAHGYRCLHDCRWPGSRTANIDHVVIGPSGVWVIVDKRLSGNVSVDSRGQAWTGRYPLSTEIDKARAQARAVDQAIGTVGTRALLSVHAATVPGGVVKSDDVLIAGAMTTTTDLILRAPIRLLPADVERLAAAARVVLASPAPPADSVVTPPKPTDPDITAGRKKTTATRTRRSPVRFWLGRGVRVVFALAVLALLALVALPAFLDSITDESEPTTKVATPAALAVAIIFECRNPGLGWTAIASWPAAGAGRVAAWGSSADGPWTPAVAFGTSAVRDGVPPSVPTFVRVEGPRTTPVVMSAAAPAAPC